MDLETKQARYSFLVRGNEFGKVLLSRLQEAPQRVEECGTFEQILYREGIVGVKKRIFVKHPKNAEENMPSVYIVSSSIEQAEKDRKVKLAGYIAEDPFRYTESPLVPLTLLHEDKELTRDLLLEFTKRIIKEAKK